MTGTRKGEWCIAVEAFLRGFFPIITVLALNFIPALVALAWSSLFAGLFFGAVVAYRKLWHELKSALFWKYVFGVLFFNGILYYVFYFVGLEYTTPGNASIVALFEVFTAYLFFNVLRREHFSRAHTIGSILMLIGALTVVGRDLSGVNIGDILILGSTCVAPLGNLFSRKAREIASSETIMFVRSLAAALVIFVLAATLGEHASSSEIWQGLPFLLINGILLLGFSKFLWIEAIHRIPVTKANALNSVTPLLTLLLAWALLNQSPSIWQLTAVVPMIIGTLLLTDQLPFVSPRIR